MVLLPRLRRISIISRNEWPGGNAPDDADWQVAALQLAEAHRWMGIRFVTHSPPVAAQLALPEAQRAPYMQALIPSEEAWADWIGDE
jgi:hypothetical protein